MDGDEHLDSAAEVSGLGSRADLAASATVFS